MTTGRAGGLHKPSVSFADSANFAAGKIVEFDFVTTYCKNNVYMI